MRDTEPPRLRITPADLATLGCYLFGRRWKTALARALRVDRRLVRRWARGDRPISERCAVQVLALVRSSHMRRLRALEDRFVAMVASLVSPEARDRLVDRPAPPGATLPIILTLAAAVLLACGP